MTLPNLNNIPRRQLDCGLLKFLFENYLFKEKKLMAIQIFCLRLFYIFYIGKIIL